MAIVRFVDNISATPNVRLDLLNLAGFMVAADGIDFSPPPLRRTGASNMMRDGSLISASSYDNRVIRLPLRWAGSPTPDAAAAALSRLGRELNRETNILQVQLGSTPVFFRTFRSDFAVQMLRLFLGANKATTAMLEITAEPFALGQRVDLGPYTINNNPANATNPQYVDLGTAITGDVETPAYIHTPGWSLGTMTSLFAMNRGPTSGARAGYAFLQAEAGTLGTDTTLPGADATMSGTGSSYTRTSFATVATMATRLTGAAPSLAPGRYTVFARVRKSVAGDTVNMRYGQNALSGTITYQPSVTLLSSSGRMIKRLGVVQVPFGSTRQENGLSGETISGAENFTVQAQRVSGTSNLDIDYLLWIPADYQTLCVAFPGISGTTVAWDGLAETVRLLDATPFGGSANEYSVVAAISGKFPMLAPGGARNVLHFLRDIDPTSTSVTDNIGDSAAVSVSYWPRYLFVA